MKGGVLEVLLVNAEGIRHTNLVGRPTYYVIAQCGTQVFRSKVSTVKHKMTWWNEKFRFEFPLSDWENLTHVKFRIMDLELFKDGGFVGETICHLDGLITEGKDRGIVEMRPSPYNVVLEDDTYEGQIKIGLKFFVKKEARSKTRASAAHEDQPKAKRSMCRSFVSLWKMTWFTFLFGRKKKRLNDRVRET